MFSSCWPNSMLRSALDLRARISESSCWRCCSCCWLIDSMVCSSDMARLVELALAIDDAPLLGVVADGRRLEGGALGDGAQPRLARAQREALRRALAHARSGACLLELEQQLAGLDDLAFLDLDLGHHAAVERLHDDRRTAGDHEQRREMHAMRSAGFALAGMDFLVAAGSRSGGAGSSGVLGSRTMFCCWRRRVRRWSLRAWSCPSRITSASAAATISVCNRSGEGRADCLIADYLSTRQHRRWMTIHVDPC